MFIFPPGRRARLTSWAATLVAVATLAGCSTDGGAPRLELPAPAAGEPALPHDLPHVNDTAQLPLAPYTLTSSEVSAIDQGRLALMDRCMRRFGFRYELDLPALGEQTKLTIARRYGVTDPQAAATLGYRRDRTAPPAPPVKPKLTGPQNAVLYGDGPARIKGIAVPAGGCLEQAGRDLDANRGRGTDVYLGQNMIFDSFARSQRDSRVVEVFRRWSACLARAGYSYPDPLAPLRDEALMKDGARSAAVATADVRCKQETRLVDVWYAVESAYQRGQLQRHSAALESTRRALRSRIAIAAQVTGGS